MTPTDDDTQEEMVAQIVPLRRREHGAGDDEPRADEPSVAPADEDWSVFDPPEDLKLAERRPIERHSEPVCDHDDSDEELERPWVSTTRAHNRLLAGAGVAATALAVATIAVLALKGHAGASPRRAAAPTQTADPSSASRALTAHQGGTSSSRHGRPDVRSSHQASRRRPPTRRLVHATHAASTPAGEERSTVRTPVEPTPPTSESEPPSSSAGTSVGQHAANEFGIER